ncbi:MAG: hypothetical protein ACI971_001902, partial [Colwellia sp.]
SDINNNPDTELISATKLISAVKTLVAETDQDEFIRSSLAY